MNLIIAGSRTIKPTIGFISFAIKHFNLEPKKIINGDANGVDKAGKQWGKKKGIKIKTMKADWDKFGRSAGHIRNKEMAKIGNVLLLIWDGKSSGSRSMRIYAKNYGLKICEIKMLFNN